ncbi:unnamed protein product [Peronospora farinosa]|uniref:Uncharacterized protein n=1 Tax=Peronospora farinosa TaxID=134698 RepID=A0ABN8CGG7_9STRA|nr:unnamed protein product [Peronospora farinosa]
MKIAGFLCVALAGIATVVDQVTAQEGGFAVSLNSCQSLKKVDPDDIRPFPQPPANTTVKRLPLNSNRCSTLVTVDASRIFSNDWAMPLFEVEITDLKGGFQDLIMWQQLTEEARCALNQTSYGNRQMPINENNFWTTLEEAYPSE